MLYRGDCTLRSPIITLSIISTNVADTVLCNLISIYAFMKQLKDLITKFVFKITT